MSIVWALSRGSDTEITTGALIGSQHRAVAITTGAWHRSNYRGVIEVTTG